MPGGATPRDDRHYSGHACLHSSHTSQRVPESVTCRLSDAALTVSILCGLCTLSDRFCTKSGDSKPRAPRRFVSKRGLFAALELKVGLEV